MFGIGFWELIILAILGLTCCIGPVIAIIIAVAFSSRSNNRDDQQR